MSKKTFILGLGAQKAGTTWLYNYLLSYDAFQAGRCKEYRIWDALTVPECEYLRVPIRQLIGRAGRLRFLMQKKTDYYFKYFDNLLNKSGKTITADISTGYAALDVSMLQHIRDGFTARGIDTKAAFLMRDPIERCWSAVRMHRLEKRTLEGVRLDVDETEAVLQYTDGGDARAWTDYATTVSNLRMIFDRSKIYYGIYESLHSEPCLISLSEFLELEPKLEFADKHYKVSPKTKELPRHVEKLIAEKFRRTYEFCYDEFPQTRDLWKGYKYL